MDEEVFRQAHHSANTTPCPFAKAILHDCAACSRSRILLIAERESVSCSAPAAHASCQTLSGLLRDKALFALQHRKAEGTLPHGKAVKIQCGGLSGLQRLLTDGDQRVDDVAALVQALLTEYGALEPLPYGEVVRAIARHPSRRSRRG